MDVQTGLDVLIAEGFARLKGRSVGLVCNQATLSHDCKHIIGLMLALHEAHFLRLKSVFGPQHGLFGHTQDNMIEWESDVAPRFPFEVHSLYGQNREPTAAMLEGLDVLVFDLQDVGSRYYTFIWTLALCLKACGALGIEVIVLDRPNPINGTTIEGPILDPNFASFVGLYPMPIRHGWTMGEIARYFVAHFHPKTKLNVVETKGWDRSLYMDETDAPWGIPSPNMPTVDTAVVYPGGCLIEATNLSEGRGTTRPFEIIGAPYLDGWKFADGMNGMGLPGVYFRPLQFEPTFNKYALRLCEGVFIHVLDRQSFEPITTFVALMQEARRRYGNGFEWNPPPYEYELIKLPIDILFGNAWMRESIDQLVPLASIRERIVEEARCFQPIWQEFMSG